MTPQDERKAGILTAVRLYAAAATAGDGMVSEETIRDLRAGLTTIGDDAMIRFLVGVVKVTLASIEGESGADELMASVLDRFDLGAV